jgi:hypothetical protein
MPSKAEELEFALNYEQEKIDDLARQLREHERVMDFLKEMQHAR